MKPYYQDSAVQIFQGNSMTVLPQLDSQSVNCCVTSPPYWGLRDYGTSSRDGGDSECTHEPTQEWIDHNLNAKPAFGNGAGTQSAAAKKRWYKSDGSCPRCGAVRIDDQLGLESTPEEYVEKIVKVFSGVKRVLRDDGTLWLNLGDSYASGKGTCFNPGGGESSLGKERKDAGVHPLDRGNKSTLAASGLKPKDLVGIPWRVAFALQADGWYLRSDIIWHKPNPMPESVTDRPTKSHEYIFLLSKGPKYYYDHEAIAEDSIGDYHGSRFDTGKTAIHQLNRSSGKTRVHGNLSGRSDGGGGCNKPNQDTRNKRTVWTVPTQPLKAAHFATFPPDLIKPCILAGCPKGGVVIDPFSGAGTSIMVAKERNRKGVGIELNPEYIEIAVKRLRQEVLAL